MRRKIATAGWVNYGVLASLIVAGGLGGLYFSGGWTAGERNAPDATVEQNPSNAGSERVVHRFPLTTLDVKDTIEAPALTADAQGRVYLAWASKTSETERAVLLATSRDAGAHFTSPKVINTSGIYKTAARGKSGGHERKATPQLVTVGGDLHLAWSEALADGSGMRMVQSTSRDGGATLDSPRPVHQGERAKTAFTAMAASRTGALVCTWLDDRSGNQQPFAAVRPSGASEFPAEQLVHAGETGKGVCPCCPTAAVFAPDGTLYVAFRNIQAGYRDIAIGRLKPGAATFEGPFPVVSNTWKFDGCPHDGPSLAVLGETLHVVWMDARTGLQRCYYAKSKLADMKFEARELHPSGSGTQGNAKLWPDAKGGLHAVWEESLGSAPAGEQASHSHTPAKPAGSGRAIHYAVMPAGAEWFGDTRALAVRPGAFQTRPVVVGTPEGELLVAWNELDEKGKNVVVTRLSETAAAGRGGQP